jgi:uncharacterized delta-60 repeat protein
VLLLCETADAQRHADVYDPGANGPVYAIAPQPDGRVVVGGAFTQLEKRSYPTRFYLGRFHYDGFLDLFDPVPNGQVHALALQPDGKIIMGGTFNQINGAGGGALRQRLARLHPDGSTDATFNPGVNGTVRALELLADGRILVAGDFTTIGGGNSGNTTRRYIARLNSNGSLDTTFHVGANGPIRAIAVQPDGKILLGGQFTTLGGGFLGTTPRKYLGRVNADGTLDESFNPGATSWVHSIAVQADRMIVVGGTFTGLGGGHGSTPRAYIGRLHRDGSVDTTFNAFANAVVNVVTIQPDGKLLVGGDFTSFAGYTYHRLGRLHPNGSLDLGFDGGANGAVSAIELQPGGHILVGGDFTLLGGWTGVRTWSRLGRYSPNGTLETTFRTTARSMVNLGRQLDGAIVASGDIVAPDGLTRRLARFTRTGQTDDFNPGTNGFMNAMAMQPDGRMLVGGSFTRLGDGGTTPRQYLGRLNADGSLDPDFNPGANGWVSSLVIEPGGTILVAGSFSRIGGGTGTTLRPGGVARLDPDGSVDATFNPPFAGYTKFIARQPDGKIVVAGDFSSTGDLHRVVRLNADGSIDGTFKTATLNRFVSALLIQHDGKILVGGSFTTAGNVGESPVTRNRIARLNADGSVDLAFNPDANDEVTTMALQADGKILIAGAFTAIAGIAPTTWKRLVRLHPDGSNDPSFYVATVSSLSGVIVEPDGRFAIGVMGGILANVGPDGFSAQGVARFINKTPPTERLSVSRSGTAITWQRSGTAGEYSRVAFEVSTDGTAYSPLGDALPTPTGWRLTGVSLPQRVNLFIRAYGFNVGGYRTGTISLAESVTNVFVAPEFTPFTDPTLQGGHVLRAVHLVELRNRINALRASHGLPNFSWTDPSLASGVTARAAHIQELRIALQEAFAAAGETRPSFPDATLEAGITTIKATHIQDLRTAVLALEDLTLP